MGDRASYRPIETPLSPSSDAVDVVRGFLALYPFPTLYAADLDAIQGNGDNVSALRRIRSAFPALRMWVDNGAADSDAVDAALRADLGTPVIGSESQRDVALIAPHRDTGRIVLSLDFRGDAFQGPEEILREPKLWPRRVVVIDSGPRRQRRRPRPFARRRDRIDRGRSRDLRSRRRARRRRSRRAQSRGRGGGADRHRPARRAGRQGGPG